MVIPNEIALLVLAAALMHAGWNTILKASESKLLDTAVITVGAGGIALATLPFLPLPRPESWPWLAASVALHFLYYLALIGAYRHGDLSHAYPLMRGGAPLIVVLVAPWLLGESVGPQVVSGIVLVSLGIAVPAVHTFANHRAGKATAFAVANAAIIAGYTLVDGQGARLSGHAISYSQWLFFLDSFAISAVAARLHRGEVFAYARRRILPGLTGAVLTLASYGIVIWAMTHAPVAAVAALRETSVIFAAVIGATVLKEPFGAWRIAGAVLVAIGIALMKL
ncbi:MAG: EamA family transporter [Betaproteobacteria bacterium]|nr:EamA family transporter [Betaproteobacteria bacterium]